MKKEEQYTKQEVINKIQELGGLIHEINKSWEDKILKHRMCIHEYISHSDITYTEAYSILKHTYIDPAEFNVAMNRVKKTILDRDHVDKR